ncbi:MAG TPA: phosphate acetyltransferase [Treponemataceae bacterium]|jgi:phosphate acetyltransferase|nr:phosphate acetyltransferase [Treponema sp.]OQB02834.1 MAG: Phosphate acetyltransferase [Spirochaetes bacterium ADurb.Bin215]HOF84556.1 phosphate acetyltransferase [Treponemataceae bacterium]HOS34485.1 phosphate acetyltransferase [Treponemataceae bacterium]HOU37950.1 phosphate acetyltransferase [Treponemataceae bacterium]
MSFVASMIEKARSYGNRLVLPEGNEPRTVKAARKILDEKIAREVFLLGVRSDVETTAGNNDVSLDGITVIDPAESPWLDDFSATYFEKRKAKGITEDQARKDMSHVLRFGAMMVKKGFADSMVAGAENTTGDVLRAGLTVIGTAPGSKTASSCFVMDMKNDAWGAGGLLIFSDCAVIPTPTSEQLADIAVSAAKSCREFSGAEPVVALLSFSTRGSGGKDENVLRVQEAVSLLKERNPGFLFDGEMQLDAALVPSVTEKKAPGSPVTGKVNTLVFPDLGAGNIGYKLVQRLGGADAYGPFLQGFACPISDLSRGCTVDDIVTTSAVTLVQAGKKT